MEQVRGIVLRARSGFYTVALDAAGDPGVTLECQLRGRVKRERRSTDIAVIGDRVVLTPLPDGTGVIDDVEPRRSRFSRRQPGPRGSWREDVLIANLDLLVAVFSCTHPEPKPRLIDRFLVVAEHNDVPALVVANKIDLVGATPAGGHAIFAPYARLGYDVVYTSARHGIGVEELGARLSGRLSVVAGPSGVGKSTLLNALQPGLKLATADVSEALGKGRHTTSLAELHPVDGGYVADTPGIRELGLWQIPDLDLGWCFVEFRPHLGGCAFSDCRHIHEPRCAIRAAVAAGEISEARHDSYRRMLEGSPA